MGLKTNTSSSEWLMDAWNQLIEPLATVHDPEERHKSRLLASLLLSVAILSIFGAVIVPLADGYYLWTHPQFIGGLASAAFLLVFYRLSRRGKYELAGALVSVFGSIILFAIAVYMGGNRGLHMLYSLIAIIVFCGLFYSLRATLVMAAVHSLAMISVAALMPGVTFATILAGPLLFNLFMVGLVVLVTFHRRRLDTEQRQRLIDSEERYKLLIEQMPLAFIEWNQIGGIKACNPAAERIFGYTVAEAVRLDVATMMLPEHDREKVAMVFKTIESQKTVVYGVNDNITKDGTVITCEWHNIPLIDKQGKVIGAASIAQDITERQRAEQALEDERNLLRTLIDNLPDQIFVKDRQSRFILCNIATAQHFKVATPDMIVGKTDFSFDVEEKASEHFDDERELMNSGEGLTVEFAAPHDGEERFYLGTKIPLRDRTGEVIGLVGINRNITDLKRAEAHKRKLDLEQERMALINRFMLAVSHDFGNSLAVIETNRYLVERVLAPAEREKVQQKLDKIRESIMRLGEQLQNLHTVYSLTNPKSESCDLNELVSALINEHRPYIEDKRLSIHFEPDTHLPAVVVDEDEIRNALKHLLVNALNYTPSGGRIDVRTYNDGQQASVEVSDTGPGIDPQHQSRIFDLFYRADSSRAIAIGGVGLGLSIARMVAEAHSGKILVESEPGQGSVFTFSLPLG